MDGTKPKLERAAELIAEIERRAQTFFAGLPPLHIEGGYKPNSSTYAFRAFGSPFLPPLFAVMAGEVLFLQRSALDHVVTKLVIQNGGTESRRNQFPICRTLAQYNECIDRGYLDGVTDPSRNAILQMQPFNSSDLEASTLLVLAEMNNADKHRLLLVTATAAHVGREIRIGGPGEKTVTGMSPPYCCQISETGGEFFFIDFAAVYDDIEVSIDAARTIAVAKPASLKWKFEHAPLTGLLNEIQRYIEDSISWT